MADRGGGLSKRVFEELEKRIVERRYPPGAHLVEDAVAVDLGVSRTPVREAFRLLERAGWLELRQHAGAYVRYPTVEEVRELFELRQTLEERAAELAAARADEIDRRRLAKLIERGRRAVGRGDAKAVALLNTEFHGAIAEAAGNALLRRILGDLAKHVRWHFSAVASVRAEDSWREHEEILAAISAGDAKRAAALAVEHSRATRSAYFEQLLGVADSRVG